MAPKSVGYTEEHLTAIRQVCQEWAEAEAGPLVTVVARKGMIVFHEALGSTDDGQAMTTDTPTWMASLTKLLTGCLLMQFVDQGLIRLDDPVRQYLSEFGRQVDEDLTIRRLVTHTTGLWGHGVWDADWNSSLENVIGHYLPYLKVTERFQYSGMGYAIAGKIMERISGRCIPYLFQECLLGPLGLEHTKVQGTAGDASSTALDMARVGQMLPNCGSYGQYRFFGEATFEKMLPVKLDWVTGEKTEREWGVGVYWYRGEEGLGEKTIGHGAAPGAILRVDPEHEVVIVCCRNTPGPQWNEYYTRLRAACTAPWETDVP